MTKMLLLIMLLTHKNLKLGGNFITDQVFMSVS